MTSDTIDQHGRSLVNEAAEILKIAEDISKLLKEVQKWLPEENKFKVDRNPSNPSILEDLKTFKDDCEEKLKRSK